VNGANTCGSLYLAAGTKDLFTQDYRMMVFTLGLLFLTFTLHGGLSEDLTFPEVGAALPFHVHEAVE